MSHLASDRKVNRAIRFRKAVEAWLDKLPPDGWEGGSRELADELEETNRRKRLFASIPQTIGSCLLDLETILAESGWTLTQHRSKHARTVRVERVKRAKKAAG